MNENYARSPTFSSLIFHFHVLKTFLLFSRCAVIIFRFPSICISRPTPDHVPDHGLDLAGFTEACRGARLMLRFKRFVFDPQKRVMQT